MMIMEKLDNSAHNTLQLIKQNCLKVFLETQELGKIDDEKEPSINQGEELAKKYFLEHFSEDYLPICDLHRSQLQTQENAYQCTIPLIFDGVRLKLSQNSEGKEVWFSDDFHNPSGGKKILGDKQLKIAIGNVVSREQFHQKTSQEIETFYQQYLPVDKFKVHVLKINFVFANKEYNFYYLSDLNSDELNKQLVEGGVFVGLDGHTYYLNSCHQIWAESIPINSVQDCEKLGLTEELNFTFNGVSFKKNIYLETPGEDYIVSQKFPVKPIRELIKEYGKQSSL